MITQWNFHDAYTHVINSILTLSTVKDTDTGEIFYLVIWKDAHTDSERLTMRHVYATEEKARESMRTIREDAESFGTTYVTQA